ncbi:MAG: 3-hydroxyacyl-CoA dehydrogenase NAD-binding domain-containing protein [Gammaproteobacteria bacterium]|nr:3-hydroxyacyl-CoA dehydrogenase NAD-binding domain-containing protein [Gammaproteobacteria bacterium]
MNRHWRLETDSERIGWLHFDHQAQPVNILSQDALEELAAVLDRLDKLSLGGLIILSDKANGFIAGADVKAFREITRPAEAESHIRMVHRLFQRIETLPFPTLAMIHGYCLGGGLELALACTYRIAEDSERTRLAFPEVRLGLFPGYGGSVRSIQRVGHLAAMQLMLSGRSINPRSALKIGLVDQIAPDRQLRAACTTLLAKAPPPSQNRLLQRLLDQAPVRHLLAHMLKRQTAKKVRIDHYPALFALIEHWRRQGGNQSGMYDSEARRVSQLLTGETAQNLIRVFFLQERLKSLGHLSDFKPNQIHVIGGGIMGGDIAAWCALNGLRVSLQDRKAEYLSNAMHRAHQLFVYKLKSKRLIQAAMDRLMPDPKGYGIKHAEVVIEAIYEDVHAKQALFRALERRVSPETLLATNTSSIPLETLGEPLAEPQRLIGLHFFNPVAKMQLVEVVHNKGTDPLAIHQGAAFVRRIDRLPLPVKSSPGFLVNRILMPYLLEAVELIEEGVPASLIDRAAKDFGMPMGPVELADKVGLDICLAVAEKLAPVYHTQVPDKLRELVGQNRLGLKSGRGFYHYAHGKKTDVPPPARSSQPSDLTERLIFRLLNEAVACLREGVVENADLLDAGIVFGTGFAPFRGGPMRYIESGGWDARRRQLDTLEQRHGDQFRPDAGWANLRRA